MLHASSLPKRLLLMQHTPQPIHTSSQQSTEQLNTSLTL
jgi:hypothetical protein